MEFVSGFDWREQHMTSSLITWWRRQRFTFPGEEFQEWRQEIQAAEVVIGLAQQNSWRGFGRMQQFAGDFFLNVSQTVQSAVSESG